MATIKSYTDIEQSKKLAEILPLESADMYIYKNTFFGALSCFNGTTQVGEYVKLTDKENKAYPCWSLAALLELLDYPQLSKDKLGSGKVGWMISVYPNNCRYDSRWHNNPVDACVEMIITLHEQKHLKL